MLDERLRSSALPPATFALQEEALLALLTRLQAGNYHFITVTPVSHARVNARPQNAVARRVEDVLGWSRPFHLETVPPDLLSLMQAADIVVPSGVPAAPWRSAMRVSMLGGGLFLHSAFPTSAPDSVFFGPDTYKFVIAIQDYLARRHAPVNRAADICTGAGPGALTIARAAPSAEVLMLDINDKALRLAAVNAAACKAAGARAVHSDLLSGTEGDFDLIVAHPPYLVDRGTRYYRHGGGPLGAALATAILTASLDRLRPDGTLLLFTGVAIIDGEDPFRSHVEAVLRRAGVAWTYREVDPDVFGEELDHAPYDEADRIALVVLEVTRAAA